MNFVTRLVLILVSLYRPPGNFLEGRRFAVDEVPR